MSLTINLEIGHDAFLRTKTTPEGFTHDWEVYVKGCNGTEIRYYVEKVVFHLHETFPKPKRVVKEPPFSLRTSGYAGFNLPIEIYLKNNQEPKKIKFNYDLQLQPTGPPIRKVQKEKYTFHNPSEEFRNKLLKGGAVVGSSSGNQDNSDINNRIAEEKNQMTSKPRLSGSDVPKKYKIRAEEPKTSDFLNLFGTPITKTSRTEPPKPKDVPKLITKPEKVIVDKEKEKNDKVKVKSSHKDKDKDKSKDKSSDSIDKKSKDDKKKSKDDKDISRERIKDKGSKKEKDREKSPPRPRSPSPKRSPKRPASPVSNKPSSNKEKESNKEEKEKKDKDRKDEKKSKKEKREHKESKYKEKDHKEHKNKDNKESKSSKEVVNIKMKENSPISTPILAAKIDKKEKPKDERKESSKEVVKEDDKEKARTEKSEDKQKHKHKKNRKEKRDDKYSKREKGSDKSVFNKHKDSTKESPVASSRPIGNSNLFGSPKSEASPPKEEEQKIESISFKDDDSSNDSIKVSSRESSPIPKAPSRSPSPVNIEPVKKLEPEKKIKEDILKKKERKEKKKDKKSDKDHEKKRKRKVETNIQEIEQPPEKICKEEENNNSDDESKVSSTEDVNTCPVTIAKNECDMDMLRDLQHKIMSLKDNADLQKVVQLIAETGQYEVSANTFDFDLCLLDKSTVKQLQDFFASVS